MSPPTGRRRGRPPGAKNKRTQEREQKTAEAAAQIAEALGDEVFEGDAHALLMSVYKNAKADWNHRLDAAKAAIRYEKPALSSIEATVEADIAGQVEIIQLVGPQG